jgi:8-oxo-dGTP diphosphatase
MVVFRDADKNIVEYDGSPILFRVSVYAVVVREGSVLIIKNRTERLFDIPGGGVEIGETIKDALKREALEEAGAVVEPRNLVDINESYFYSRSQDKYFQSIQLFYKADLIGELGQPIEADNIENKFVNLVDLENYPLAEEVIRVIKKITDPLFPA